MKHKSFWLVIALFVCRMGFAQPANFVERVIEVRTNEKNPSIARTILLNDAAEKASEDLIKEIIGEAKYSRNRALIQSKILKKSASYLPFSKAGELKQENDTLLMSVTVRANVADLQRLLLDNGLFYDTDSTPSILPMVKWMDKVNAKNFGWWMAANGEGKDFLIKESRFFENSLHEAFLKSGFYVIRPQTLHYEDFLGAENRGESIRPEDSALLAGAWNAQVVLEGQVQMAKSTQSNVVSLNVRLAAVQVLNGRVIAEVARQFDTEPGAFDVVVDRKLKEGLDSISQDLSAQLLEAWKQGAINSQLYRLKVTGRLPLPVQEALKEALRSKVREIKSVKERLIEANEIVYELQSSIAPSEIAKKIGDLEVQGLHFVVSGADEKELSLKVQK